MFKSSPQLWGEIKTTLKIQARVLWALLLREIQTRFGQTKLGYFWVMLEPILHTIMFTGMFMFFDRRTPIGESTFLFLITSFIPYFLFRDLASKTMNAITANQALLEYPIVKNTDVIIARVILEIFTYFFIGILIFIACAILELQKTPANPIQFFGALLAFTVLGVGLGTMGAVLSVVLPIWSKIISLLLRFLYFFSGIMFSVTHLPPEYRIYFLYNPITHAVEMLREGFYFGFESQILSYQYLFIWCFLMLFLGFALEVLLRKSVKKYKQ